MSDFKTWWYNEGSAMRPYFNEDIEEFAKRLTEIAWSNGEYCEREACDALHQHEDVLAPVGNSAWGEAYQEGWAAGAAAYRDAIRARGQA